MLSKRNPSISWIRPLMKRVLVVAAFLATTLAQATKYPYLPNPMLTPGVAATTDINIICEKSYPQRARKVSAATKNKVYRTYGVDKEQCVKGCKIDHLIPLAIGGSNDIKNLWPHEYGAEWNVFAKTRLEVRLRKEVCTGKLPIVEAQSCIRSDWTKCYLRFFK